VSDNTELVIRLDRERMAALARMDLDAAAAYMGPDMVWTHVNARVDEGLAPYLENGRSGVGYYTSMEGYDVKAYDYGSFVILTGGARIGAAFKGTFYDIDCRFTSVWTILEGNWKMVAWQSTNKIPLADSTSPDAKTAE
jgi:ketosteroid isomerase-like protein